MSPSSSRTPACTSPSSTSASRSRHSSTSSSPRTSPPPSGTKTRHRLTKNPITHLTAVSSLSARGSTSASPCSPSSSSPPSPRSPCSPNGAPRSQRRTTKRSSRRRPEATPSPRRLLGKRRGAPARPPDDGRQQAPLASSGTPRLAHSPGTERNGTERGQLPRFSNPRYSHIISSDNAREDPRRGAPSFSLDPRFELGLGHGPGTPGGRRFAPARKTAKKVAQQEYSRAPST
mmetsp:Transcript_7609/g.23177  ORF Transcript_7609/g.23177 Transcript_7609/m.23177 type:complete len:232 (-) Transcript_7609:30-725(-)